VPSARGCRHPLGWPRPRPRRKQIYHSVGTYGWNGGLGTTRVNDPAENLTLILLTQQAFTSHLPPAICRDFWTAAYQALAD